MNSQTDEQKKIMAELENFVRQNRLPLSFVAKKLGVTQNTVSNWRKGLSISLRNQNAILEMIQGCSSAQTCTVRNCTCRNKTNSPLMTSILELLGEMNDNDLAHLYPQVLDYYSHRTARRSRPFFNEAAEERGSFNTLEMLSGKQDN